MKPSSVPGVIILVSSFLFCTLNLHNTQVEAASIICGNESASKRASFKTAASATNEQSSPNQETTSDDETPLAATTEEPSTTTATPPHKPTSDVKQFFRTVQCTLEKAKPWVEEIEKEAKRLEETAKRFSEGVINKLGDFIERLVPNVDTDNDTTASTTAFTAPTKIPTKSLFSTILDGFENVVVGVVGTVTGTRLRPTKVVEKPVKDDEVIFEATNTKETEEAEEAVVVPVVQPVVVEASSAAPSTTSTTMAHNSIDDSSTSTPLAHNIEIANDLDNQILQTSDVDDENIKQICPIGFVADINGVCQRVKF